MGLLKTWENGTNTKKGVIMRQNTAKIHEMVSKVIITNEANPDIAQAILSWTKDTVNTIISKDKF